MHLSELQTTMRDLYAERDRQRGVDATFRWLTEEVGELARAIRKDDRANLVHEFSDVLVWVASLAKPGGRRSGGGGRPLHARLPEVRRHAVHVSCTELDSR